MAWRMNNVHISVKPASGKREKETWKIMGILGAGHACGATHLAVWAANCLSSVCREKTAVLEWNSHGDFQRMFRACNTVCSGNRGEILGVNYYACADAGSLAACLEQGYERILIDYGVYTQKSFAEWVRCDKKILVGSFSEWQADNFLKLLGSTDVRKTDRIAAVVFGSEEMRHQAELEVKSPVLRIPFSADAYTVTGNDMNFFRGLW